MTARTGRRLVRAQRCANASQREQKNPTRGGLERASRHVRHEVVSLRDSYEASLAGSPHGWTAWYVHMRNLAEFSETSERDNIRPEHFGRMNRTWRTQRDDARKVYGDHKAYANDLATHLSWDRVEHERADEDAKEHGRPSAIYAPSLEVTEALEELYESFVALADERWRKRLAV